jgi:hypothetical protein
MRLQGHEAVHPARSEYMMLLSIGEERVYAALVGWLIAMTCLDHNQKEHERQGGIEQQTSDCDGDGSLEPQRESNRGLEM